MPSPDHIRRANVKSNVGLCDEHFEMTLELPHLDPARPGQFVHLCPPMSVPPVDGTSVTRVIEWQDDQWPAISGEWLDGCRRPMLRRAFSIAGRSDRDDGVEISIIYRVVGSATTWLSTLGAGDAVDVLGPLGHPFPVNDRPLAYLVAGGVGLPPLLWLAEHLRERGKTCVAFYGARTASLLAIPLSPETDYARDAGYAAFGTDRFSRCGTGVVISTDDGSVGFRGHVGAAFERYCRANPVDANDVTVYTCGPEIMMRNIAATSASAGYRCFACMERTMACGIGTCQSCVIAVRDEQAEDGWRYRLCCDDGPVFDANVIEWSR